MTENPVQYTVLFDASDCPRERGKKAIPSMMVKMMLGGNDNSEGNNEARTPIESRNFVEG